MSLSQAGKRLESEDTCARRPEQKHALDVADSQPLNNRGREHARGEGSPKDLLKLVIQAADPELLKVELLRFKELRRGNAPLPRDREV